MTTITPISASASVTLVAFDTVFEQCSLAIMQHDKLCYLETMAGSRGQTEVILPMLDEALRATGLDVQAVQAWAFNRGPGAFSGIRINTAVVQALSVANDAPCVGVSSLEVLAYQAHLLHQFPDDTRISALIDARQNEVYVGDFVINKNRLVPSRVNHEYLAAYGSTLSADVVVGNGGELVVSTAPNVVVHPDASHIASLAYLAMLQGASVPAGQALPVYLRHHAWKTLAEQQKK